MELSMRNGYHISPLYRSAFSFDDDFSHAVDNCPGLVTRSISTMTLPIFALSIDAISKLMLFHVSFSPTAGRYFSSYALDRLRSKNEHFALVCDEFGELAGVVTPSDILEGLVGVLSMSCGAPRQAAA